MYYRITKMAWDPSKRDEIYSYIDSVEEKMKALGAQSISLVEVGEGSSISIAAYSSKEDADKAAPKVGEILGGIGPYMTAAPEPYEGEATREF